MAIQDPAAKAVADELFAIVRRLGALGLHSEAQSVQERATGFWMAAYGREMRA